MAIYGFILSINHIVQQAVLAWQVAKPFTILHTQSVLFRKPAFVFFLDIDFFPPHLIFLLQYSIEQINDVGHLDIIPPKNYCKAKQTHLFYRQWKCRLQV